MAKFTSENHSLTNSDLDSVPIKILMAFFTKLGKYFKIGLWKYKSPPITKEISSIRNSARGITIPDCKLFFRFNVTKVVWC